jgi:hypothetical protein
MGAANKQIVFLSGPIGVGKTTIGTALALRHGGAFVASDALSDPAKQWHEQIEAVNSRLIEQCLSALQSCDLAFVELPLDRERFEMLRRAFEPAVSVRCITLAASYETITSVARGRIFEGWERVRIKEMIEEGYDSRDFSDAIVRTDSNDLGQALAAVMAIVVRQSL